MLRQKKPLQQSTMAPDSLIIERATYFAGSKLLRVWLKPHGHSYIYAGVSKECWEKFTTAPSKGQYYNTQICEQFEGIPV